MNVNEIPLTNKPTHGSVQRIRQIDVDWMILRFGLRKIQSLYNSGPGIDVEESVCKLIESSSEDSALELEFVKLQNNLGEYQTIMLATGWPLKQMLDFSENAPDAEYQDLLKRCIETLGGNVADFFGGSGSGSACPEKPLEETKHRPNKRSKKP